MTSSYTCGSIKGNSSDTQIISDREERDGRWVRTGGALWQADLIGRNMMAGGSRAKQWPSPCHMGVVVL
jgi:hypothetical protein